VEVGGLGPFVGGEVVDEVVLGGVDGGVAGGGVDGEVEEVGVVVDPYGGDRLGLGLACSGVGGEYFVPDFDLVEGDAGAVG
jgi:hypothetical protein